MQWSLTAAVSTACFLCGVLSPVQADEARPRLNDSETISEFNRHIDAGDLSKAEDLAREAFLQSSSNPQAVLMVRQVFLMKKLQMAGRAAASAMPPKSWRDLATERKLTTARTEPADNLPAKVRHIDMLSKPNGESAFGADPKPLSLTDDLLAADYEGKVVPAPEASRTKHKSRPLTDSKQLREELQSRVFAVADLVVPVPQFVVSGDADHKGATTQPSNEGLQPEFDGLINLITHTIEPDSWSSKGGEGNIKSYSPSLGLVVRQTPTVQARIEELLSNLRKEREIQVSLEVTRIEATPEVFAKLCQSLRDIPATDASAACTECDAALQKTVVKSAKEPTSDCPACEIGRAIASPGHATGSKAAESPQGKLLFSIALNSKGVSNSDGACCETMNCVYQSKSHVLSALIASATWAVSPVSMPSVWAWISSTDRKPVTVPKPMWISAPERERLRAKLQGDVNTHLYYLPKITLFNGQSGSVSADSHSLQMLGTVSPNHKRVRLTCSLGTDSPDQPGAPVTFALSDSEAILLPVKPEPGRRPKRITMFLITPHIVAPAVEAECLPCEEIGATSLFSTKSTVEVSQPSLMESLYGSAIKHRPLPMGGSVSSKSGYAQPADDQPKYFRSGGVEFRR